MNKEEQLKKEIIDNHNWIDEKECFIGGFNRGYKIGIQEERERVFKEVNEWFDKRNKALKNTESRTLNNEKCILIIEKDLEELKSKIGK